MKRIIFLLVILVASATMFGQSPVADGRIADTTTLFTVNMPVGTKLYVTSRDAVFVCKVAAASGTKISTGVFANWTQLATGAAHSSVTIGTANGLSLSGQQISLQAATGSVPGALTATDWTTFNGKVPGTRTITATAPLTIGGTTSADLSADRTIAISAATTGAAGSMSAADKTKLDGIAAGATANVGTVTSVAALTLGTTGTDLSSSVATGTSTPVITLNVPTASASNRGVLSTTDWSTFNGKMTSTLTSANMFVGNGSNVATGVAMSGDATLANTGAVTIANSAVSLAKMANLAQNTIIGRVTASTGVPEALTGANVRTISNTNHLQQNFENTTADSTNYTCTLTNTPLALGTITVQLNGQPLIATTQYTIIMTNRIRVSVPAYKYDKISIAYQY